MTSPISRFDVKFVYLYLIVISLFAKPRAPFCMVVETQARFFSADVRQAIGGFF
jgi:hypothetical protein